MAQSDREHLENLLNIHRRNLQVLEGQRAVYGTGAAPLHLLNQIAGEQDAIKAIEIKLGLKPAQTPELTPTTVSEKKPADNILRLQLLARDTNRMEVRGLIVPGGGNPRAEVELPYTLPQLKAVLKGLDVGAYVPERFKPEYVAALTELELLVGSRLHADFHQQVGQVLYQALFSGDIIPELITAQRQPGPIACQLCFDPEDVVLGQFPWELVHDQATHLVLVKQGVELTRYVTFANPPQPLQTTLPLRLLFISPRPKDDQPLPETLEREALLTALVPLKAQQQLVWQHLEPPTWTAFEARLNDDSVDIIHFDGHGSFARVCLVCGTPHYPSTIQCTYCHGDMSDVTPEGFLHFEDEYGQLDRVSIRDMKYVLANSQTRLVVLTACRSGVVHGASVFNGVAPGLIQIGIPAIVAMQGSPQAGIAATFVERFYDSLTKGYCIPEAVNRGRSAIARAKPPAWFMPVVYLRTADNNNGCLFDIK